MMRLLDMNNKLGC